MASMTHYTKKSFEACLFNPLSDGKMLDAYPQLKEIVVPEWANNQSLDYVIRYTIMIYDPKSMLVTMERDLNYRKGIAAELAGFDMEYEDMLNSLYNCSFPLLLEFTVKYLVRFVRSKEWAAICALEYKYWEAIKLIMQPISTDKSDREQLDAANKKDVLSESIDQGLIKLDTYYKVFFNEDDVLEKSAKRRMTPELMAEKRN